MEGLRKLLRKLHSESGQGMTEYIIIVGLVAIGAIAVVTVFGDNVRALFGESAAALAGESITVKKGDGSATAQHKNLNDFNKDVGK